MKTSITSNKPKITFMTTVRTVFKNRWINLCLKLLILGGAGWAFYNQTLGKKDADEVWGAFVEQISAGHIGWLILAIVLLPLTYQVEVWKWELAISKIVEPTRIQIVKSILAGTALGFWTPGQIGDFGGRLLFIETKKNGKLCWRLVLLISLNRLPLLRLVL